MRQRGGTRRPDVIEYCRSALDVLVTLPPEKVQAIDFETAILGQSGLEINNPDTTNILKELSGEFTGLRLAAVLFVAFQQIAPGTDVGIDFSREYEAACGLQG